MNAVHGTDHLPDPIPHIGTIWLPNSDAALGIRAWLVLELGTVSLTNIDAAVWCHQYVIRFSQMRWRIAHLTGSADDHK